MCCVLRVLYFHFSSSGSVPGGLLSLCTALKKTSLSSSCRERAAHDWHCDLFRGTHGAFLNMSGGECLHLLLEQRRHDGRTTTTSFLQQQQPAAAAPTDNRTTTTTTPTTSTTSPCEQQRRSALKSSCSGSSFSSPTSCVSSQGMLRCLSSTDAGFKKTNNS
jgi:hypothetical protein